MCLSRADSSGASLVMEEDEGAKRTLLDIVSLDGWSVFSIFDRFYARGRHPKTPLPFFYCPLSLASLVRFYFVL